MSFSSILSWLFGEQEPARRKRHEQAASKAAQLARALSASAVGVHGRVAAVPMGTPVDLSRSQWRGDDLPDAVLFSLPASAIAREGTVRVQGSDDGSRVVAAVDAGDLEDGDRMVLIATSATRAAAVVLQPGQDQTEGPLRGEVEIDAPPPAVDVRLLVVSPASAHGQERG